MSPQVQHALFFKTVSLFLKTSRAAGWRITCNTAHLT